MKNKINNITRILFPNKKINYLVVSILFIGIITGAIFSNIIDLNDQKLVIEKIETLINNINNQEINNLLAFKNSIITNMSYTLIIWILGLTIIGIIVNIFLLYVKGFIFGFSLSSFIITYNYKGIILSIIYTLFGQLLNIIVILTITIYSIMFSINLLKKIIKNNANIIKEFKNYSIILFIIIITNIISSLSETFIFPTLIKIIIKIFI